MRMPRVRGCCLSDGRVCPCSALDTNWPQVRKLLGIPACNDPQRRVKLWSHARHSAQSACGRPVLHISLLLPEVNGSRISPADRLPPEQAGHSGPTSSKRIADSGSDHLADKRIR